MSDRNFAISGLKEVKAKLQQLPEEIGNKAVRTALRQASKLVRDAAYNNALAVDDPTTGRRIADNVVLQYASKLFKRTNGNVVAYRIGVSTQRGRIPTPNRDTGPRGSTPHWHLVEFGTEHSRAQPFMRPALDNNLEMVTNTFVAKFSQQIDKLTQ